MSLLDVDGDGMADLYGAELGGHTWRRNRGGTFDNPRHLPGAEHTDLKTARYMDLDGDARPELVTIVDDTWRVYKLVRGASGGPSYEWVPKGECPGTAGVPLQAPDEVFADIGGDGRTDVIQGAAGSIRGRMALARGLGPVLRLPMLSPEDAEVEPGHANVEFADINGGSLVDVLYATDEFVKMWLGRGDGRFVSFKRVAWPWQGGSFDVDDLRFADLDRDGLLDVVRFTAGHVVWYLGMGGFDEKRSRHVVRLVGAAYDSIVTVADANGNGSQDVVWSDCLARFVAAYTFGIEEANAGCLGRSAAAQLRAGKSLVDFYVAVARSDQFRLRQP